MITTILSGNVKSNPKMPRPLVERDVHAIASRLDGGTGSAGLQEIAPWYYVAVVKAVTALATWWPGRTADAVPIMRTLSLLLVASGRVRTHFGIPFITPPRWLVWEVFEDPAGARYWHLNTHFISSAWSGKFPKTQAMRRRRWLKHNAALIQLVAELLAEHGPNGVVTGDFNRPHYLELELLQLGGSYHWPDHGTYAGQFYDYLIVFGAVHVSDVLRIPLNSDHDAIVAAVTFPGEEAPVTTPPKFVPRSEWGARYAKGSGSIPGPVRGVTLHWEGPTMGTWAHDKCAGKVRVIERFHAVTRGWSGIAYSAVVCPHGYVFEGRGPGVRPAANGESAIGGNDRWYAVCYLGGVGDPFTVEARSGYVAAVQWLRRAGGAGDAVNGHRDHHSTECPGDTIYRWLHTADFEAPPGEDDTMQDADWTKLRAIVREEIREVAGDGVTVPENDPAYDPANKTVFVKNGLSLLWRRVNGLRAEVAALAELVKGTKS